MLNRTFAVYWKLGCSMTRSAILAMASLPWTALPAYALGEQVVFIMAIDAVLFIAALLVITLVLKCPAWMRGLLVALYVGTEWVLYLLPVDLVRPPELNGPFHFALPTILCATVFITYIKLKMRIRNGAP